MKERKRRPADVLRRHLARFNRTVQQVAISGQGGRTTKQWVGTEEEVWDCSDDEMVDDADDKYSDNTRFLKMFFQLLVQPSSYP